MKIKDLQTVLLSGPYSKDPFFLECRAQRSAAFVEVHTDTELVGIGETYAGYFFPEAIPGIVEYFKPLLIGQTVDHIAAHWSRMYGAGNYWCRVGLGTAVINAVEAALWDLKGKMYGVPVYELLGGCKHPSLLCYASGGPSNYPKERLAAKLDFYRELGFQAVKLGAGCYSPSAGWYMPASPMEAAEFEGDKLAFVRNHVGKAIHVMLDGHMGNNSSGTTWGLATAQAVARAVEPYDLFFFEEPLPYTDPWSYAELCRSTPVPIAGGECLTAVYEWRVFAEQDSFDIGQPDAAFTGGIGEFIKVAAMLESRGRKIATHSAGAGGALMQNLHCAFACANTVILEMLPALGGLHTDVMASPLVMKNGRVQPPEQPGLGLVLTDEIKRRYPFVPGRNEVNEVPALVPVKG